LEFSGDVSALAASIMLNQRLHARLIELAGIRSYCSIVRDCTTRGYVYVNRV
jgi:hypothetical protein